MDNPLVRSAAVIAYLFKLDPRDVLDCDQRTWSLRVAAAKLANQIRAKGVLPPTADGEEA